MHLFSFDSWLKSRNRTREYPTRPRLSETNDDLFISLSCKLEHIIKTTEWILLNKYD